MCNFLIDRLDDSFSLSVVSEIEDRMENFSDWENFRLYAHRDGYDASLVGYLSHFIFSREHIHPFMCTRFTKTSCWPCVTDYLLSHRVDKILYKGCGIDDFQLGLLEENVSRGRDVMLLFGDYLVTDFCLFLPNLASRDAFYGGLLDAYKEDWEHLFSLYGLSDSKENIRRRVFLQYICLHSEAEYRALLARYFPSEEYVVGDVVGLSPRGKLALLSSLLGAYYYASTDCDFSCQIGDVSPSAIPNAAMALCGLSNSVFKYAPFGIRSERKSKDDKVLSEHDTALIKKILDSLKIDAPVGMPADTLAYYRKKRGES